MPTGQSRAHELEPATADMALLVRVAEMGTLSAVARERDVPVSHVSRAITWLENLYKVRLVNRSTHGLSLTPEGDLFLAHARRVNPDIAVLETSARSGAGLSGWLDWLAAARQRLAG